MRKKDFNTSFSLRTKVFIGPEPTINMAKQENTLDKLAKLMDRAAKLLKGPYKAVSGAVLAALFGAILKLTEITKTFPPPADLIGNIIIFAAVLFIAVDLCRGGLLD